ncbi:MAG: ERCC4 domain-containing protein [Candidatus Thorarchaeota archaeon]
MSQSLIYDIESREYQEILFAESVNQNSLIVLPTGLGKTIIILYLVAYFIDKNPDKKILIATPTRPLVHQIFETFRDHLHLNTSIILEIDGNTPPNKRESLYKDHQIIISTPQTLSNDILANRLFPQDFQLLCFDEAHRATGNYSYVKIMQIFEADNVFPRIIAFTATPGNNQEQILAVLKNLKIKAVLSRFSDDVDVKPYVSQYSPKVEWIELPSVYRDSLKILDKLEKEIKKEIENRGIPIHGYMSKTLAMDIQKQAIALMHEDPEKGELLNYTPNLIRILHLRELIETQGLPQASTSLSKWIVNPEKKTLKDFVENPLVKDLYRIIVSNPQPHPKLQRLIEILNKKTKNTSSKIIIFSNFRDTVELLYQELPKAGVICKKFIGQSSGAKNNKGMSQKEQLQVLDEFKNKNLNVLISTSVGEEGLDVGSCDLVIFYDSVSSIVRSIQRIGRGRKKRSEVIRLIAKSTKDAAMYFGTKKREKEVERFIRIDLPKIFKSEVKSIPHDSIKTHSKNSSESKGLMQFFSQKNVKLNDKIPHGDSRNDIEKIKDNSKYDDKFNSPNVSIETTNIDELKTKEIIIDPKEKNFIIIDPRERFSNIPRLLKQAGLRISLINLPAGDYKLSNDCVIERKTAEDFAKSIIDGRLFEQISQKLTSYRRSIILIIGSLEEVPLKIAKNALLGALASIVLNYRIPVLQAKNEEEASELIIALAKREQKENESILKDPSISKSYPIKDIQRFVLGGIPGINRTKADLLLENFQTIQNIANAVPEDIVNLPGFGEKLSSRIHKLMRHNFNEEDNLE